jgi:hypothetical protein
MCTDVGKSLACFCLKAELFFDEAVGILLVSIYKGARKTRTQLQFANSPRLAICCSCVASWT